MKENIGERTKSSLFWNTALPVFLQVIRFAISIIIARLLNPRDFGIMGIASIMVFYASNLTNFGFNTALIQRKEINENHYYSFFSVNLGMSVIFALLTCLLSGYLAVFFDIPEIKNVLIVMSVIFISSAFYIIPETILRREVRFKTVSVVELIRGLTQTVLSLAMVLGGFGYWSLVFGLITANIVAAIVINIKVRWLPKIRYDHNSMKQIFNFSIWNFFSSQANLVRNYIDKFIIGKFMGPVLLGYYDKAFSIAWMPVENLSVRVSVVMFSAFARTRENLEELSNYFSKIVSANAVICCPVFFGLIAVAHPFVEVLLGDKWLPMIVPLQILSLALIFGSFSSVVSVLNTGAGDYRKHIRIKIYCILIMVALCLLFVKWGINAISVVMLVYHIIFLVISFNLAREVFSISWTSFIGAVFPAFSGSVIMLLFIKTIDYYLLAETGFAELVITVIAGAAVYITYLYAFDFKHTRFIKDEVRKTGSKLKRELLRSAS